LESPRGTSSANAVSLSLPIIPSGTQPFPPSISVDGPELVLQATIIDLGASTLDGALVVGVATAWFEIVRNIQRDPQFLYKIHWRKLEELIAGAYERVGWPEVVLTPRSGDRGRDIIASRPGVGSIRIVDQVKAYSPGHLVTADDVRSVLGVLEVEQNASKGLITTTSDFAPGILTDHPLAALMPYRLELKNGNQLLSWLTDILKRKAE
jgi:restriction system protein